MKNIKGLRVDVDSGEGEVVLPESFSEQSYLWQADVLGDWKHDINELYENAVEKMYAEFANLSLTAYRKRQAKENQENVNGWIEAGKSCVGSIITDVTRGKNGEVFLSLMMGGEKKTLVMYHGGHIKGQPQVGCDILEETGSDEEV